MIDQVLHNVYFDWLYGLVCKDRFSDRISYKKLLMLLHNIEFRYSIPFDENRADDGFNLRYRFARHEGAKYGLTPNAVTNYLNDECSVLEMMIALAIRCEDVMDNPHVGDRTKQWFWGMVTNLGLGAMDDGNFDKRKATDIVNRFLDRQYSPDGAGGLFTIYKCPRDVREMEIWHQCCWYLESVD